jgi:hypothetical protein
VTHPDANALAALKWQEWRIPLQDLAGVNVAKVKKMIIGVGNRRTPRAGGTGKIYVDDICLMKGMP